jgi:hypothetical protein
MLYKFRNLFELIDFSVVQETHVNILILFKLGISVVLLKL